MSAPDQSERKAQMTIDSTTTASATIAAMMTRDIAGVLWGAIVHDRRDVSVTDSCLPYPARDVYLTAGALHVTLELRADRPDTDEPGPPFR